MSHPAWFEISEEGWRRLSTARPLGRLLLEAVQNAFDAEAPEISISLGPELVTVEDDAPTGFADERLVYTLFLSDKSEDPAKRGRLGRGLKELIASMTSARVELAGRTIDFGEHGRQERRNARGRGTRLELQRRFGPQELQQARALLGLCIAPKGTSLWIDGAPVRRPGLVLALSSCELETVVVEEGIERATTAGTQLAIYAPGADETPHVFEMGVPVEGWEVPWHVDVGQRVPLLQARDGLPDRFKMQLRATLLEAMIHRYLDRRDLRADWVLDTIARWPMKTAVLDTYVSQAFPRGAVLEGTRRANDRARQLGAHVIEAQGISHGAYLALSRVIETADDHVRRRSREFAGEDVEPDAEQRRFAEAVRWLARRVAGRVVRVRFFSRDPSDAGLLEDARTDPDARVVSFNIRGPLRFDDILDPNTLGVVLHELAHLETPEHDHRFIERLQWLAGQTSRILAEGGPSLARALRRGDPGRERDVD